MPALLLVLMYYFRYTDFIVHEIAKDGTVVHLHDFFTNAKDYTQKVCPNVVTHHNQLCIY